MHDAVSMSSQLDTYIAEVLASGTLSVNAFECWHARGPSRLAKGLICCMPATLAYVERIFSVYGCSFGMMRSVQVSRDETLSETQSESAERNLLSPVSSGTLNSTIPYHTSCPQYNSLSET